MNSSCSTFRTGDLSLASFLRVKGHKIIDATNSSGRAIFTFKDTDGLQINIRTYLNDEPVEIPARSFLATWRDLKGMARAVA
jgi:hypothetical protein